MALKFFLICIFFSFIMVKLKNEFAKTNLLSPGLGYSWPGPHFPEKILARRYLLCLHSLDDWHRGLYGRKDFPSSDFSPLT